MAYIGKSPQNGVRNRFVYAATQGQTAFTGADADSKTLAISDALYTDVYQNGVKLKLTTDWTATTTTVTLVNAASVDDVIEIVSFDVFSVSDTVPASTGGTFNGGITATAATITTATNEEDALLVEQSDGTDVGALRINNGRFVLSGRNSSTPVQIQTHDGNEDIEVDPDGFIKMETAGAERLRIDASGNVGIGTTSPESYYAKDLVLNALDEGGITIAGNGANQQQYLMFADGTSGAERFRGYIGYDHNLDMMQIVSGDSTKFLVNDTAEAMRINSSGNVGIGTTSPGHKLSLQTNAYVHLGYNGTSADTEVGRISSNSYAVNNDAYSLAEINFTTSSANGYTGDILFRTNSVNSTNTRATERMRITSAGKMGFGTSTQILNGGGALASFTFGGAQGVFISTVSQSGGECMGFVHQGSSVVGTIAITSSATSYNTSSDYRLKENVNYTWDATTRLKQLKPAQFNWIADDTNTLVDGFLAHEVSSVVPQAITKTKDAMTAEVLYEEGDELPDGKNIGDVKQKSVPDYQGIDQSKLVPLLVKALQEQQTVIESLTTRITALESA